MDFVARGLLVDELPTLLRLTCLYIWFFLSRLCVVVANLGMYIVVTPRSFEFHGLGEASLYGFVSDYSIWYRHFRTDPRFAIYSEI